MDRWIDGWMDGWEVVLADGSIAHVPVIFIFILTVPVTVPAMVVVVGAHISDVVPPIQ
jgi:hypothetical protein